MQKQVFLHQKALFNCVKKISGQLQIGYPNVLHSLFLDKNIVPSYYLKAAIESETRSTKFMFNENFPGKLSKSKTKCVLNKNVEELNDDDELCPVDCVREFMTDEEFSGIMEKAKESNALVVVDFYRTSCGSCKYIEQGFAKLCKGSGKQDAPVIFLKHNVLDEYDEQSEVAERLWIKCVPLFHFYKNGVLLEAFATRDKERILEAILKYTASSSSLKVDSIS